jgi:predicted DNA-binding transcriptional regulator YafY
MDRIARMFEVIQILRAARAPVLASTLAERLEVSVRTVYRDVSALQAMRVPVEGAAGVGYVMRRGYDLPPLNFDQEEVEALQVGLLLLSRTGDTALQRAAQRINAKVDALQEEEDWLRVQSFGAPADDPDLGCVTLSDLRGAIRGARKLALSYCSEDGQLSERTVCPVAMVYNIDSVMIAAWCELRAGFRHFRVDRIQGSTILADDFVDRAHVLRSLWLDEERRKGWA